MRQAILLRAAHDARALGLHRASAAAIRVVEGARAARADDPAFRLADLVVALRELLTVSHRIRRGLGAPDGLRGVARRAYLECGDLRLYGLCCVPVLDPTGYAGVVTYLSDAKGRMWQLGDVTPGGLELATGRADNPVHIGEARVTFRELGRAGLFVSAAKASADGRLSSGGTVRAVRGSGLAWTAEPLAGHWTRGLAEQVSTFHDALRLPVEQRPAGHDLAFLTGRAGSARGDEVPFTTLDGHPVRLVAPTDNPGLPYLPNLRMLADVTGDVRLIGRFAAAGRVEALAAGWDALPDELRRTSRPRRRPDQPVDASGAPHRFRARTATGRRGGRKRRGRPAALPAGAARPPRGRGWHARRCRRRPRRRPARRRRPPDRRPAGPPPRLRRPCPGPATRSGSRAATAPTNSVPPGSRPQPTWTR